MSTALLTVEGVSCRACGAVRAPAGDGRFCLCGNCWSAFERARRGFPPAGTVEEDLAIFLARQLFLDVRRLKANGVVGRCEAVSDWMYGRRGYQCGLRAIHMRDGRRVCGLHHKATSPAFVDEPASDPYAILENLMRDVAAVDDRFAAVLARLAGATR